MSREYETHLYCSNCRENGVEEGKSRGENDLWFLAHGSGFKGVCSLNHDLHNTVSIFGLVPISYPLVTTNPMAPLSC